MRINHKDQLRPHLIHLILKFHLNSGWPIFSIIAIINGLFERYSLKCFPYKLALKTYAPRTFRRPKQNFKIFNWFICNIRNNYTRATRVVPVLNFQYYDLVSALMKFFSFSISKDIIETGKLNDPCSKSV